MLLTPIKWVEGLSTIDGYWCETIDDAAIALETLAPQRVRTFHSEGSALSFMFPGQGAQYVNMALELYEVESVFREQIDLCSEPQTLLGA